VTAAPVPDHVIDDLAARLGPSSVLRPEDGLDAYDLPARPVPGTGRGRALCVARPRSTAEVREVLSWARRHRVRVVPQGANTGLVGASTPPPDQRVAVLSTELLAGPPTVDPVDRTVVAGAGTRLSALDAALAPYGLWLPIDLAADPTVGGMVATNTGGARMIRHGDVRRHVLGVEAVLADDAVTVVEDLSTLRKDNAGLDLAHLFVGSAGALGIITKVALDLDRRPRARATALVATADPGHRLTVLFEAHLGEHLSALEAMSAEAVSMASEARGLRVPFAGGPPPLTMLVEASTTAAGGPGVADLEALLAGAVEAATSDGLAADAVLAPPGEAWALRHALTEGLRRHGQVLGFDVSVPRRELGPFRAEVRAAVAHWVPRAVVADFGHWGDGGIHCNVVLPATDPASEDERRRIREIVYGAVAARNGSFSAEHGIGPLNADLWEQHTPDGARALSRRLKDLMDPLGVLGHPGLPYGEPVSG
jgi:FAD/FMN-containing dehydrogenase